MIYQPARGRRAQLVPVLPEHYDFLYTLAADPATAWRWRFRGVVPSRDQFVARLWDSITAQFLVVDKSTNGMAGLVSFYNYNSRGANGYIAAISHPAVRGRGVVSEGCLVLVDQMMKTFDLAKIYFEALEFNVTQYGAISSIAKEEARLVNHEMAHGRHWDSITFALYREDWEAIVGKLLVTPRPPAAS